MKVQLLEMKKYFIEYVWSAPNSGKMFVIFSMTNAPNMYDSTSV